MEDPDSAAIGLAGVAAGRLDRGSAASSMLDAVAFRFLLDLTAFGSDCRVGGTCESSGD